MTAAVHNFTIEQGTTFSKSFVWKTGPGNGSIVDITGFTARLQIREKITSPTPAFSATTANSNLSIVGDEGKINLSITAAQSAAFLFDTAVYDLELTSPANEVTRLVQGSITLSKSVTR